MLRAIRDAIHAYDWSVTGWVLVILFGINVAAATTAFVIICGRAIDGMRRGGCWTIAGYQGDYSNTDLSPLEKYIRNEDDAKLILKLESQSFASPAYVYVSPFDELDRKRWPIGEIRTIDGLSVVIGVIMWDKHGIISDHSQSDQTRLELDPETRSLPGVAFVWPRDTETNEVILRGPNNAVRFHLEGETESRCSTQLNPEPWRVRRFYRRPVGSR